MKWIKADFDQDDKDMIIEEVFDNKMKGWLSENFQRNITDEEWNRIIEFFKKNDDFLIEIDQAYNTNPYDAVELLRDYWDNKIKEKK